MPQSSGWFMYAPNTDVSAPLLRSTRLRRWWGEFRRTGGFRTVELNAAGWSAVVVPGVVVGFVVGRAGHRRLVCSVAGGVSSWVLALAVDRSRWRRSSVAVDITGLDDSDWLAAQQELVRRGIEHRVEGSRANDGEERRCVHSTMRHQHEILEILHSPVPNPVDES